MSFVVDLAPTADGDHVAWGKSAGGPSKWENMSDDVDVNCILTGGGGLMQSFFVENLPGGAFAVTSLKTYGRVKTSAAGRCWSAGRLGNVDGVTVDYGALGGGYAWFESALLEKPGAGTGDWLVADINGDFEIYVWKGGADSTSVTEFYARVAYTVAPGGWACMLLSVLGPVFGAGILLSQMPDLIRVFNRATRKHLIEGCEAVALFNDIRAEKFRRYAF